MTDIKTYKLDAAFAPLKDFDFFAKPDDFIEVSLWRNGEGFDAHLSTHGDQAIAHWNPCPISPINCRHD